MNIREKAIKNLTRVSPNWAEQILKMEKADPEMTEFDSWHEDFEKIYCKDMPDEVCYSITDSMCCVVGEAFYGVDLRQIRKKGLRHSVDYAGCDICNEMSFDGIFSSESWEEFWKNILDWTNHFLKEHKDRLRN